MAIAQSKPTVPDIPKPTLPHAIPENFMGLTYDNSQQPITSLISYVEGAPWTVDEYYRQIVGQHNDLKEVDVGLSPEYQSYSKIIKLELRLQQELSGQTDQETQFTSVEGSALVYGFLEPNPNDYFIAEVSHLRKALFRVTTVDRVTWRRESVFGIQFTMVDYVDRIPLQVQNLKDKTTSVYVFSKDRLMENLNPYLRTETYAIINDLNNARKKIGDYYLSAFSYTSTRTLNMPGQPGKRIYDCFLVDFCMATMGYLEFPDMIKIKQLPTDGDQYLRQPQFWKAILDRDPLQIQLGNQKMALARTDLFLRNTWLKTLFAARMDFIVYPKTPDISLVSGEDLLPKPTFKEGLKMTTGVNGMDLTPEQKMYVLDGQEILSYKYPNEDDWYVMSQAFYTGDRPNMSLIELMTTDYLNDATLDLRQLTHLINLYPRMERLAQYYYGPLLMCLTKYADQKAY
jgi:hypothetical protein